MKKILAALLAVVMIASILVSCVNGEEKATETEEVSTATETGRLAELGARDFDGAIFTILDANDYPDMHVNYATEETQTQSNIAYELYKRDAVLKTNYNLSDIRYISITKASDGCTSLSTQILAGQCEYDMVISTAVGASYAGTLPSLGINGMLKNLVDVDYLSLDKEWWSPLIYERLTINDTLFFTTGDIAPSLYQAPAAMYVNMELFEQYHNGTDIFEIVENGEWTLGKLRELTKDVSQDLNEDNIMRATDDFFGIAMFFNGLSIQEFVIGAGATFSTVKDNDLTMDNLKTERLANLINTIKGLFPSMKYTYGDGGDQQNVIEYAFKGGKSIFLAHQLECAMFHLRDMKYDYAVLPYPKADTTQTQYISNINNWCDCFVSVPLSISGERTEFVGFMMEAMAAYSRDNLYPFIYGSVLKYQRVNDPQSSAMVDVIMDGIVIDYAVCYDIGGLALMAHNAVMNNVPLSSSAISASGTIKSSIKKILEAHGVKK